MNGILFTAESRRKNSKNASHEEREVITSAQFEAQHNQAR